MLQIQSAFTFLISQLNETIASEALNETAANNGTDAKPKATTEGRTLAYISIVLMAVIPIIIGSFKSVKAHQKQKDQREISGEMPETMTTKDAAMFPLIASGALFGLYIFFKLFSKEYINLLLTGYFFFLGVLALTHSITPYVSKLLPQSFPVIPYHLQFSEGKDKTKKMLIDFKFDTKDIFCLCISLICGFWYLWKKHWVANNIFGIAFSINGVELLHLNRIVIGCILLGGLFVYDVFWVFGTDVMVTVAKSFEAPIKLIFPQDFLENGFAGTNFAMLGLGDIVVPGIFIALLLRYDVSLNRKSYTYFYASFFAYVVGLVLTIVVMTIFKHAQPALLYLVPACIGFPLALALLKGDIKTMFEYEDHPEKDESTASTDQSDKKAN
ncbi:minor histocompatibility antigen H13-like protein [Dinothrombium tinctorium]|uniref:Minor histocompatibility antigen H13-like protein n=1 Tax=Dinothrombium tinctorium TaxID=1965070 RepID=A0A3S3NY48_9ACAR|nr:minor histocompatibility antigen H13-like protein [Dinothrombium tinctorium]RWS04158.1 minor histocompatibility antigen H13-like protein [Dinothrombium tinctorium]RWS06412.1 minor histocompatibility antigen H13-like protein [Dinothrombium tinctorium]